jgi:hypothetical protein
VTLWRMKKQRTIVCTVALAVLVMLPSSRALGADYYLYVDQNDPGASDSHDGQSTSLPLLTVGKALDLSLSHMDGGNSVHISIGDGTYREFDYFMSAANGSARQSAALTLEGDPGGGTRIRGSVADGFEPGTWQAVAGQTNIYEHAWTNQYGVHAGTWADTQGKPMSGPGFRREMLFADATMLMPRTLEDYEWVDPDGAGGTDGSLVYQGLAPSGLGVLDEEWTFAVADHASTPTPYRAKIFMRVPAGFNINSLGSIEVSQKTDDADRMFHFVRKNNVTLRHLTFQRAGTRAHLEAVKFYTCTNTIVEDCEFSENIGTGFGYKGSSLTMRRCRAENNGWKGVGGNNLSDSKIVDSEFNRNCWMAQLGNLMNFDAAGVKFGKCHNILFKRCIAIGNIGSPGLWNDIDTSNIRYEECFSYGNGRAGFHTEYSGSEPANTDHSIFQSVAAYNKDGIEFSNCRGPYAGNCLLVNNTDADFWMPFYTTRDPQTAAAYVSLTFTNNLVYNQVGGYVMRLGQSGGFDPALVSVMRFGDNEYHSSAPTTAFRNHNVGVSDFSDWKNYLSTNSAADDDASSSITTLPDFSSDPYDFEPGSEMSQIAEAWDVAVPYHRLWPSLGYFSLSADVGSPARPGYAGQSNGTYAVVGSGAGLGGTNDAIHLLSKVWSGDGDVIVQVTDVEDTGSGARAGLMFRETTAAGSKYAAVMIAPGSGAIFSSRLQDDQAASETSLAGIQTPYWVRLNRTGNTISGYVSADGGSWQFADSSTITMSSEINIGLFTTAQDDTALCTATFDGLRPAVGNLSVGVNETNMVISWDGNSLGTYTLQRKLDLVTDRWSNIVENIPGIDRAMSVTNDTSEPQAFYRIISE